MVKQVRTHPACMKEMFLPLILRTNTFSDKPLFIITRDNISDFLTAHTGLPDYDKLWSNYNKNNPEFSLGPSGIALIP